MGSRGELRHDAAIRRMHLELAGDDVGQHTPTAFHDSGSRFITRRFDSEDTHDPWGIPRCAHIDDSRDAHFCLIIDVMTTTRVGAIPRMFTLLTLSLLFGFAFYPSGAFAHSVVYWDRLGPVCTPLPSMNCVQNSDCVATIGESCRMFEGDVRMCGAELAAYCVTEEDAQCPLNRPHRVRIDDAIFCMSDRYRACPTTPRSCFSRMSGASVVDWDFGDCDRDGQANAVDPLPCVTAPFIATVNSMGECHPTRVLCRDDTDCRDGLQCWHDSTPDSHRYCVSSGAPVFCCGGFVGAECPNGHVCSPDADDGFELCHSYCEEASYEERLRCLRWGDTFPVPAEQGDCDGDGLRNQAEVERGTDPCVGDDAGVVSLDAGTSADAGGTGTDAGLFDGSTSWNGDAGSAKMDGSVEDETTFAGGGGFLCHVHSGRRSMPWGIVVGFALMFAVSVRRTRIN